MTIVPYQPTKSVSYHSLFMFIVFIVITLCALCVDIVHAENKIIANGILEVEQYAGHNILIPDCCSSNTFRVTVDRYGRWAIQVQPIYKESDILFGRQDTIYMTYDGCDSYSCHYTEAVQGITNGYPGIIGIKPISKRNLRAYISSGNYPFSPDDNQKRAHILWIAFCSGSYIREGHTNTMPLPWISARSSLRAYGFCINYKLASHPPHPPQSLNFIRDSRLDLGELVSELKRYELDKSINNSMRMLFQEELDFRNSTYNDGDLRASYFANSMIITNDMSLPLSFSFDVYDYHSRAPGMVQRHYSGYITDIILSDSNESFRPPIYTTLTVFDSRFRDHDPSHQVDGIVYKLYPTNQWNDKIILLFKTLYRYLY